MCSVDIGAFIEENYDYIQHLLGNCACTKCNCGACNCLYKVAKHTYASGFKTIYSKDFRKLTTSHNDLGKIVNKNYIFGMDPKNMFKQSLYHKDFINTGGVKAKTCKPPHVMYDIKMVGSTNYSNNYVNWRMGKPPLVH